MRQETVVNTALGVLTVCAIIVTGITINMQRQANARNAPADPVVVKDWQKYASAGHRMGPNDAPVIITEFSDFQCPFCKKMHEMLEGVTSKFDGQVSVVYRHYPLPMHKEAMPAAIAAECAGAQGRFDPMHDALFAHQDSLGKKSWESYAQDAGVPDIATFTKCLSSPEPLTRIAADTSAAKALEVRGTPTLIINDLKVPAVGTDDQLEKYIKEQLKKSRKDVAVN